MIEPLLARAAASGPPVEPLTKRLIVFSSPFLTPGTFVATDVARENADIGLDAPPNQPRYTSTSARPNFNRGSVRCSEPATEIALAGLPGLRMNCLTRAAPRSVTSLPPRQ